MDRILNRIGILKRFNILSTVSINNKRFKIPVQNWMSLRNKRNPEHKLDKIFNQRLIDLNDCMVIYMGVNLGQTRPKVRAIHFGIAYS